MDAGLLLQNAVVALAVLASLGYVLVTRFPKPTRRLRGRLAIALVDSGYPSLARLGRRLAPAAAAARCGGCNGCGD